MKSDNVGGRSETLSSTIIRCVIKKKKCAEISVDERIVCTYCTIGVVPDNGEYG